MLKNKRFISVLIIAVMLSIIVQLTNVSTAQASSEHFVHFVTGPLAYYVKTTADVFYVKYNNGTECPYEGNDYFYVYGGSTSSTEPIRFYDNSNQLLETVYLTNYTQVPFTYKASGTGDGKVTYDSTTIGALHNPGLTYYATNGAVITLKATANTGSVFTKWIVNGVTYTTPTATFTATSSGTSIEAVFDGNTCSVTTTTAGTGSGTVTGGGATVYGSTTTLGATPSAGSSFVNWTLNGTQVSTNPTYTTPPITSDATYVANFASNLPGAPTNLTASDITTTTATVSWSTVSGATTYKVYKEGTLIGTNPDTHYNIIGLELGKTYTITVSAVNATGEGPQSESLLITAGTSTNQPTDSILQNPGKTALPFKIILVSPNGDYYYEDETKNKQKLEIVKVSKQSDLPSENNKSFMVWEQSK